jgi:hypothetical protein
VQPVAQLAGAFQVVAERLLHDQPPPAVALAEARRADSLRRARILAGLCRQVKEDVAAGVARLFNLLQTLAEFAIQFSVADVAGNIEEAGGKPAPHVLIEGGVFGELLDRLQHVRTEFIIGHRSARRAHHGEAGAQPAVVCQAVKGRH